MERQLKLPGSYKESFSKTGMDMNSSQKELERTTLSYVRSQDEIQRAGLARLASALSALQPSAHTLQVILQIIADLYGTDQGVLCLRDPETSDLEIVSSLGLDEGFLIKLKLMDPEERACGIAFKEKKRVFIKDIDASQEFKELQSLSKAYKIRAIHSIPILTRSGKCIGVISVYFPVPRDSTELEIFLTDISIHQIANIVERIQAEEVLKKKNDFLFAELDAMKNLYEHSIKLITAPDLPATLNEVLKAAISITHAESGNLYMAGADQEHFQIAASCGFRERLPEHGYKAIQLRQRVIIHDDEKSAEPLSSVPAIKSSHYMTVQSTPLIGSRNNILGVISTYYSGAQRVSEIDMRMLDLYLRYAVEIIERKVAEAKRQADETPFRAVVEGSPILIWVTDATGHINFVNREYLRYFDVGEDQVSEFNWPDVLHPDDRDEYLQAFSHAIQNHAYFQARARVKRHDGQWRWIESRGNPLIDKAGQLVGYAGSSPDITEIYESQEFLKQADQRKDEFLAILAHELRNPLAPISNAVEIMRNSSATPEKQIEARELIDRQIKQIVRLVDDLMDVSRITRGKMELRKICVRLSDVIEDAIETVRPLLDASRHTLHVTLAPEAPYVYADPTRITQIFANILNNAAKYTDPGGQIWLTIEKGDGIATIYIKDNGIGISADKLDNIFNMFSQVESALNRAQGGLGIGLTLVKNLVHLHGGDVEVRSEGEGKGTEFIIRIPLATELQIAEIQKNNAVLSGLDSSTRRRILVVDDNEETAQTMGWMMEMYGHDVRLAHSGKAALEVAASYKPDFVFLDIGIPDMNGYDICKAMNQMPELKNTIFVAQTGWGQKEHRVRSHEAGFNFHLVKPVDTKVLQAILHGDDEFML
jgi:PAS domain S-box-containing protein